MREKIYLKFTHTFPFCQIGDTLRKASVGIATGGDDPRSTNQTFQNFFDSPDIRLDKAYVYYQPTSAIKIIGGKFGRKDFLWASTDLLWDGATNVKSREAVFQYALRKNVTPGIDYYFSNVMKGTKNHRHLLQTDLLLKF